MPGALFELSRTKALCERAAPKAVGRVELASVEADLEPIPPLFAPIPLFVVFELVNEGSFRPVRCEIEPIPPIVGLSSSSSSSSSILTRGEGGPVS